MRATILTVGAEILAGDILDTNFRELARELTGEGILVTAHASVQDEAPAIAGAVRRAMETTDLVIVTGGLGPTPDDRTREGVAHGLGVGQTLREDLRPRLEELFRSFGRTRMPESNLEQLRLPDGAEAVFNPVGTAPGFRIEAHGSVLFAVPGIPREMRAMLADTILPWLREHRDLPRIEVRVLRTMGIGESDLHERLQDRMDHWRGVGVAFYPRTPGVDLKLIHHGKDPRRAQRELGAAEGEARGLLGRFVYGTGGDELAAVTGSLLVDKGWTVATAESCTGGSIAAELTAIPGASRYFDRGVIAYSNRAKTELLGVPAGLIGRHGAVSEPVARAMAEGLRERHGVDVAVATTGIAGPGGGTPEKPVGLVHTAIAAPDGTRCWEMRQPGARDLIVRRTTVYAVDRLRLVLLGER